MKNCGTLLRQQPMHIRMSWSMVCGLFLLGVACLPKLVMSTVVARVDAGEESCFIVRLPAGGELHGSWDILDDELETHQLSVVLLEMTKGTTLYRSPYAKRKGVFHFSAKETKRLEVCIQNGIFRHKGRHRKAKFDEYPRDVALKVEVGTPSHDILLNQHTKDLYGYSDRVWDAISDVTTHYENRRHREKHHRRTVEMIFTDIMKWTLAQVVFVVLLAVGQILLLRRVVERRSGIGFY